jgi:hypothetical protein
MLLVVCVLLDIIGAVNCYDYRKNKHNLKSDHLVKIGLNYAFVY